MGAVAGSSTRLETFFAELSEQHLSPLWTQYRTLMPERPTTPSRPFLWEYASLRRSLLRAGDLVDHKDAIRRSLNLVNPGLQDKVAAVGNLYAAVQLVLPGEIAPSHRHGAAALRFIIEGSGGFTAVDGERTIMHPGDLVLTPSWTWHDHGNDTDQAMIWMDGLDMPLINALEASFYEADSTDQHARTQADDASLRIYGAGVLAPAWDVWNAPYSPLINYPWERTERALQEAARDSVGSPYDGVILQYVNPKTSGSVVPTMAAFAQLLPAGARTQAHRHTSSSVYHVVRGSGTTIVDGEPLQWTDHDIFAVPTWAEHHHENQGAEPAYLFSFTDEPVLRALALYREQG